MAMASTRSIRRSTDCDDIDENTYVVLLTSGRCRLNCDGNDMTKMATVKRPSFADQTGANPNTIPEPLRFGMTASIRTVMTSRTLIKMAMDKKPSTTVAKTVMIPTQQSILAPSKFGMTEWTKTVMRAMILTKMATVKSPISMAEPTVTIQPDQHHCFHST